MNRQEIFNHLTNDIIPFWNSLRDEERGGFCSWVDAQGNRDFGAEKGTILHARILWFYSSCAHQLDRPELLEYARHAWEFINTHCISKEHGGIIWSTDCNGKPLDTTMHTYCMAFVIYALAAYYRASGDEEILRRACELFDLIESRCRCEVGYVEAHNADWTVATNLKLSDNPVLTARGVIGSKTMNTVLHLIEAYTTLYEVSKNERVGKALADLLILCRDRVFNREKNRLEVFFDDNLNSIADLTSYGHDIEASWLLDEAADALGDDEISVMVRQMSDALAQNIYTRAIDRASGSLLNEELEGEVDRIRIWWVQAETVVGFCNAWQRTGREEYFEAARNCWQFIVQHQINPELREWHWMLDDTLTPGSKPIVEPWKCPYHNGRMCLEVLRRTAE